MFACVQSRDNNSYKPAHAQTSLSFVCIPCLDLKLKVQYLLNQSMPFYDDCSR